MTSSDHARNVDPASSGRTWPPGWIVDHVPETGSTNADLVAAAADGAPDRSVLATGHQTAGRGRLDRRWDAPPGANLLVSLLLRSGGDPAAHVRRVALAARFAAGRFVDEAVELKWPNDLLLGGRKLAGILAQRCDDGAVVVGMGLNVGWAPEGAARLGDGIEPLDVLAAVLEEYDRLPADILDTYRDALATIGQRVRVEMPGDDIVGTALDVLDDGRLVVLDECGLTHRLAVGDIVHLRPR